MTFWKNLKTKVQKENMASNITMKFYKKVATSGTNMLGIIKPSFYVGQLSVDTYAYMSYVEKFLSSKDRDWGECVKFIIYIREISKKLLNNIQKLQEPMESLIHSVEEIYEGESIDSGDELEEEPEPEEAEELEDYNDYSEEDLEDNIDSVIKKSDDENIINGVTRESLNEDYEEVLQELKVKIRQTEVPERVEKELSREIADIYLECVQLDKELSRLEKMPDGDLSTLLSILVDINFGLCQEMKKHLTEDILIDERFSFNPGILTWTSHFLSYFSEQLNEEWQHEES